MINVSVCIQHIDHAWKVLCTVFMHQTEQNSAPPNPGYAWSLAAIG